MTRSGLSPQAGDAASPAVRTTPTAPLSLLSYFWSAFLLSPFFFSVVEGAEDASLAAGEDATGEGFFELAAALLALLTGVSDGLVSSFAALLTTCMGVAAGALGVA